ncbi:MAG TPA: hypothetical protein VLI05_01430 [Candidatus Saccharimonadia bacterium]|nr:hypothetical protein [Candidatus Saccharimonadia bacterium]
MIQSTRNPQVTTEGAPMKTDSTTRDEIVKIFQYGALEHINLFDFRLQNVQPDSAEIWSAGEASHLPETADLRDFIRQTEEEMGQDPEYYCMDLPRHCWTMVGSEDVITGLYSSHDAEQGTQEARSLITQLGRLVEECNGVNELLDLQVEPYLSWSSDQYQAVMRIRIVRIHLDWDDNNLAHPQPGMAVARFVYDGTTLQVGRF